MGAWHDDLKTFNIPASAKETVPKNIYCQYFIKVLPTARIQIGSIIPFAGLSDTTPSYFDGIWAACEGAKLPSSRFKTLYNAIGKCYGSPEDKANFLLADLQELFICGFDMNAGRDLNGVRTTPLGLPGSTSSVAGSTQQAATG